MKITSFCDCDRVTTAYYIYDIDLTPRVEGKAAPLPGEITRQTPPL